MNEQMGKVGIHVEFPFPRSDEVTKMQTLCPPAQRLT